jgi:hypothetical protein
VLLLRLRLVLPLSSLLHLLRLIERASEPNRMATAVFKGAAAGSAGAVAGGGASGAPCELLFAMPVGRVALSPGQRCTLGRGLELGGREGAALALALAHEKGHVELTLSGPRSPSLSALHATVTMGEDTRWRICDPGSLNGVFHNLARISAPTVLS